MSEEDERSHQAYVIAWGLMEFGIGTDADPDNPDPRHFQLGRMADGELMPGDRHIENDGMWSLNELANLLKSLRARPKCTVALLEDEPAESVSEEPGISTSKTQTLPADLEEEEFLGRVEQHVAGRTNPLSGCVGNAPGGEGK